MESMKVLNDTQLRQIGGGRDERTILPHRQGPEFWYCQNPAAYSGDNHGFIDSDDYIHPLTYEE